MASVTFDAVSKRYGEVTAVGDGIAAAITAQAELACQRSN